MKKKLIGCIRESGDVCVLVVNNSQKQIDYTSIEEEILAVDFVEISHDERRLSYENFLSGIEMVKSEWLVFLAVDDFFDELFFVNLKERIEQLGNTRCDCVMPAVRVCDQSGQVNKTISFDKYSEPCHYFHAPIGWFIYSVVRTEVFLKIFRSSLIGDWTDYLISAQLVANEFYFDEKIIRYYEVPDSVYVEKPQGVVLKPAPIIRRLLVILVRNRCYKKIHRFICWSGQTLLRSFKYNIKIKRS